MTIRTATYDDLAAIVAIYNETIPGRMVTADTEEVTVTIKKHGFIILLIGLFLYMNKKERF